MCAAMRRTSSGPRTHSSAATRCPRGRALDCRASARNASRSSAGKRLLDPPDVRRIECAHRTTVCSRPTRRSPMRSRIGRRAGRRRRPSAVASGSKPPSASRPRRSPKVPQRPRRCRAARCLPPPARSFRRQQPGERQRVAQAATEIVSAMPGSLPAASSTAEARPPRRSALLPAWTRDRRRWQRRRDRPASRAHRVSWRRAACGCGAASPALALSGGADRQPCHAA